MNASIFGVVALFDATSIVESPTSVRNRKRGDVKLEPLMLLVPPRRILIVPRVADTPKIRREIRRDRPQKFSCH